MAFGVVALLVVALVYARHRRNAASPGLLRPKPQDYEPAGLYEAPAKPDLYAPFRSQGSRRSSDGGAGAGAFMYDAASMFDEAYWAQGGPEGPR